MRKQPFLFALTRWGRFTREERLRLRERGETAIFAGYHNPIFGIMLESHLVSERQFLYRHLVDVGMFPAHKMWPNEGVHIVGSESNHTRRAQKQSEGREPRFFALVSALFFPRQFFSRALNALNRLNKM